MSKVGQFPIASQVEEAAAAWVARHDSGPLDPQARAEFDAWLEASPAHRAAYGVYDGLWSEFDALPSRPTPVLVSVAEPANDRGPFRTGRRAVAASIALALILVAALFGINRWADTPEQTYATAVGEQRTVTLADNSRITLNTDTQVLQEFSDSERRLRLDRGEALFEVAHDPARPFIVMTPAGTVTAVGTKFVVRISGDGRLNVLVTEGRVLVAPDGEASSVQMPGNQPLAAGEQLSLADERATREQVSQEQATRELAWRQGDIVFSGESLSQAASEMQRYSTTRIRVDPAVAHYSVGGYFRTNDVEAFLQTVEQAFPVRVIRGEGEVRLVARPG